MALEPSGLGILLATGVGSGKAVRSTVVAQFEKVILPVAVTAVLETLSAA